MFSFITDKIQGVTGRIKGDVHLQQASSLFTWNLIAIPINLAINFFLTRYMGAEDYGNYSFMVRTFSLACILVNLGLFRSVGRSVLLTNDENRIREYYGVSLLAWIFTSVLSFILLFIYAFASNNVAEKGILSEFLILIPLCSVQLFNSANECILPSSNKIKLLIVQRYFPRIFLMICAIALFFLYQECGFKFLLCVCLLYGSMFLVYLYVGCKIKPRMTNIRQRIKEVLKIDKEYGIKVYSGDLLSNAFVALMPLLISLFSLSNADVGFYSLALTLCTPMNFIPGAIMTSHFKKFSTYKEIPKKVFKVTILASLACLIVLWIIITPFVNIFFTPEYHPVILLTIVTSVGTFLYGMSDFLSRYLSSQGDGVALRNSSIAVGFVTLVCSLILISRFGAMGAAITHGIAGICYVFIIFAYYRKCVKRNYSKQ